MTSIDNSPARNYLNDASSAFVARVAYSFNPANAELTITDQATAPSGDTIAKVHVEVFDKFGSSKRGVIAVAAGNVVIDLDAAPALNLSQGVDIATTTVTTKGLSKDGSVSLASGILANAGQVTTEK